jgi:hypothetical protein
VKAYQNKGCHIAKEIEFGDPDFHFLMQKQPLN